MNTTTMNLVSSLKTNTAFTKFTKFMLRQKSFNSNDWLKRRQTDRYVEIAKQQNYRCRSAFKLIEINKKYKFLEPGLKVLDIGAAPGSWSQVLADRTNSNRKEENSPVGLVIAIDLSNFQDIEGVIKLPNMDFNNKDSQLKILEILGKGQKFDYILSDMAPDATGVKFFDQERIISLIYPVVLFSVLNLRVGGGCLVKSWDGKEIISIKNEMKRFFKHINVIKPNASYVNSSEIFLFGREFLGLKTDVS